jgi:hypothetical protein
VIPPFLLRLSAAQPSGSDVASNTSSSIGGEQQHSTKKVLASRPLRNLHGDAYYVTLRPGTGKSHFLKCYILMVHAQRSQLRNFRRLARSHGYSVSTPRSQSLAGKDLPHFSSHGFPKYFGSFHLQAQTD